MRSTVLSRIPRRGTLVVAATLLAVVNCEQVEITTVNASRVELQPQNASIAVSESARLTATVLSSDGKTLSGRSIEWSSLQTNIATVDNTGMVRGLATGVATIRAASGEASGTATVTVTAAPAIAVNPTEITFSAVQNGSAPGDRTATVSNGGTGSLNGLTATVRYAAGEPNNWLTASLAGTSAPTALILSANQRNFAPGTYNATVDIASSTSGVTVRQLPVRLTVLTPAPAIGLGTNTIAFTATTGGADPAQQTVGVTNAGGATLTGLGTTINYQAGQRTGWLTATLSNTSAPATLTLRAATAGMPAGNYTANVLVTSGVAQNSPQTVTVTFAVTAVQTSIAIDQRTLTFTASRGGASPAPLSAQVTSASSTQIAGLSAAIAYTPGQPTGWATATLNSTTTPASLTVTAATGALPTGIHTAVVSVASPNATNSPQTIDLAFNVVDPLSAPTNLAATAVSSAQINLSWTAPAGVVTRYRIERKTGAAGTYAVLDSTTTNSYQNVGLSPGTQYFYRVSACNPLNCSPASAEANATTGPGAPGSLTASAISSTQIDLAWSASAGTVTRYRIERKTGAAGTYAVVDSVTGGTLAYSSSGLVPATQYFYRVQACNAALCSPYSTEANATTGQIAPGAPSSLSATAASATQINLTWSTASGTVTRYRIERKLGAAGTYAAIDSVASGVTSYSDVLGLAPNTQYFYRVQACNSAGCSPYSVEANATTPQVAPGTPTGLVATTVSATQINLGWTASSGTVAYYRIEQKVGAGGTYAVIDSVFSGVTYPNTGLTAATTYFYRVTACNSAGCSAASTEASATTLPLPPAAPTNLTVKLAAALAIDLTWTGSAPPVSKYIIDRRVGPTGALAPFDSVAAGVTTYQDTRVSAGTDYTYEIRACNTGGCSGPSNQATQLTVPGVPAALLAAAVSSSQINLSWAAVTGATAYYIESRTGAAAYAGLATVSVAPYHHTGLTPSTVYFYQIAACNSAGCSGFSVEASDTTFMLPPQQPATNLALGQVTASEINISWTMSPDPTTTYYRVERSNSALVDSVFGAVGYKNIGLTAGTQYSYQVRACNQGGCTAPTNQVSAFTLPAAPASVTATAVSSSQIDLSWPSVVSATSYKIDRVGTGNIATITGSSLTYADTALASATTYSYQVQACNSSGCGAFTAASATTLVAAPSTPTGVVATATGLTISLTWTASTGASPRYIIERRTASTNYAVLDSVTNGATSYTDSIALSSGTDYYYRIQACNVGGCSGYSTEAVATTMPPTPASLSATIQSGGFQVIVTWQVAPGATSYVLEYRTAPGTFLPLTTINSGSVTSYAHNIPPPQVATTSWDYRIVACNAAGCSAASQVAAH